MQKFRQQLGLGRRYSFPGTVRQKCRITANLPQTQKRGENRRTEIAVIAFCSGDFCSAFSKNFIVKRLLFRRKVAIDDFFCPRRQIGGHFRLCPAFDKGTDTAGKVIAPGVNTSATAAAFVRAAQAGSRRAPPAASG